jgi:WD40 repeat protein
MTTRNTPPSSGRSGPSGASSVVAEHERAALAAFAFASRTADESLASRAPFASAEALEIDLSDPAMRAFGDYELLEILGRGGMGVVYRARQASLDRDVALKLLGAGPWAEPAFVERFRGEARHAARMQHPNIVTIHEVGDVDGLHFYSMRLVRGASLAHAIARGERPAPRHAAQLVRTIAEAVDYAHRLGVLHLDLKPANVLVDENGAPHIADFGLARRLDALRAGGDGIAGTPEYMAPEQASPGHALTAAADIWGLGAILHELLTGEPPFHGETVRETLRRIVDDRVPAPRSIAHDVPRDLEAIVLKCLEKDPAARYATARVLADDLQRFVEGRPVVARPLGAIERARRWTLREPKLAATAMLAVAALVGGLAATTHQWRRATASATLATTNASIARDRLWQTRLDQAEIALRDGRSYDALPLLVANIDEREAASVDARDDRVRFGVAERSAPRLIDAIALGARITGIAISPDGASVAVAAHDQTMRLIDTATGTVRWQSRFAGTTHSYPDMNSGEVVLSLPKFSADGRFVIGRHWVDIPWLVVPMGNDEVLFDAADGRILVPPSDPSAAFRDATYSADGRYALVHTRDGRSVLRRTADWRAIGTPASIDGAHLLVGDRYVVSVSGPDPGFTDLAIRDARTLRALHEYTYDVEQRVSAWAASADGTWLVVGHVDGRVERVELATGRRDDARPSTAGRIGMTTFSPDGRWFGAVADSGDVLVWDTATTRAAAPPMRLDVQPGAYHHAQLAIDATARAALASSDAAMSLWQLPGRLTPPVRVTAEFPNDGARWFRDTAFDAAHGLIATDGGRGELRLWRMPKSAVVARGAPLAPAVLRSADARAVAVDDNRISVVSLRDGRTLGPSIDLDQMPTFAELSEDGASLYAVVGPRLLVFDAASGQARRAPIELPNDPARFEPNPDSRHVLLTFADNDDGHNRELAQTWDVASGTPLAAPLAIEAGDALRFNGDGGALLQSEGDRVRALDPLTLAPRWPWFEASAPGVQEKVAVVDAQFVRDASRIGVLTLGGRPAAATFYELDAADGAVRRSVPLGSGAESFAASPAGDALIAQRPGAGPLWWDENRGVRALPSPGSDDFRALALANGASMFARATSDAIVLASARNPEWLSAPMPAMLSRGFEPASDYPAALAFARDDSAAIGRSYRALILRWDVTADTRPARELVRESALLSPRLDAVAPAPALDDGMRRALRSGDPGAPLVRVSRAAPPIPPRRGDTRAGLVALDNAYTAAINARDADGAYEDVSEFAPGLHRFIGVDFDARGEIDLYYDGTEVVDARTPHAGANAHKPHRVENIRPGLDRFGALTLLVTGGGALNRAEHRPYAFVEIAYRDGVRERLPLVYRVDMREAGDNDAGRKGERSPRVAWRQTGAGAPLDQRNSGWMYAARLDNPRPDRDVASLAIEAAGEAWSTPVVYAITLEPEAASPRFQAGERASAVAWRR